MKYAIISDIHSNLEALNTVLREIDKLGIKQIISPGDMIGYGPFPDECVKIFKERNIKTAIGNHEAVAVGKLENAATLIARLYRGEKRLVFCDSR